MKLLVEKDGEESIQLARHGGFVLVRVPVRIPEQAPKEVLTYRYRIGSFLGRETRVLKQPDGRAHIALRIPSELFRPRERLSVAIVVSGDNHCEKVIWSKRYEAGWKDELPLLEPVSELLEPPEKTP